jgi:LysR family transcriptional activator of glutamate synthase operon
MQVEQLRYLVEIARTGSISAAALNLHVSQSAISKSLLRLEHNLGIHLFNRLQTGVSPTETGKRFIEKANEVLDKMQEFEELTEQLSNASSKKISLACVHLFTPILSESLEMLMKDNPQLHIDVAEKKSKEIMQDVIHNTIDIGFMVVNPDLLKEQDLKSDVLLESDMYVCVNKNSTLSEMEQLYPEDLLNQNLISYNCNMVDWLNFYFNDNSFQYSLVTNNLDYIQSKISQNSAISIIPELIIRNHHFLRKGDIIAIPLRLNDQSFKMQVASVRLKKHTLSRIAADLLKKTKLTIHTNG